MAERINAHYTPEELKDVLAVLNEIIQCTRREPTDVTKALYVRGYRVVKMKMGDW